MKIYATGEAIELGNNKNSITIPFSRVIGLINLGNNNGDNNYGWSGLKAVLNYNDIRYVLDFPEDIIIKTNDDIFIIQGQENWCPSLDSMEKFDLFLFNEQ